MGLSARMLSLSLSALGGVLLLSLLLPTPAATQAPARRIDWQSATTQTCWFQFCLASSTDIWVDGAVGSDFDAFNMTQTEFNSSYTFVIDNTFRTDDWTPLTFTCYEGKTMNIYLDKGSIGYSSNVIVTGPCTIHFLQHPAYWGGVVAQGSPAPSLVIDTNSTWNNELTFSDASLQIRSGAVMLNNLNNTGRFMADGGNISVAFTDSSGPWVLNDIVVRRGGVFTITSYLYYRPAVEIKSLRVDTRGVARLQAFINVKEFFQVDSAKVEIWGREGATELWFGRPQTSVPVPSIRGESQIVIYGVLTIQDPSIFVIPNATKVTLIANDPYGDGWTGLTALTTRIESGGTLLFDKRPEMLNDFVSRGGQIHIGSGGRLQVSNYAVRAETVDPGAIFSLLINASLPGADQISLQLPWNENSSVFETINVEIDVIPGTGSVPLGYTFTAIGCAESYTCPNGTFPASVSPGWYMDRGVAIRGVAPPRAPRLQPSAPPTRPPEISPTASPALIAPSGSSSANAATGQSSYAWVSLALFSVISAVGMAIHSM